MFWRWHEQCKDLYGRGVSTGKGHIHRRGVCLCGPALCVSTGLFWFIDAIIICDKNRNMSVQEEMEGVHGALMQLLEQYDEVFSHEDRVQNVQDVRDLLSVTMQMAEGDEDLLNRIQALDNALEQAMGAPDNILLTLLESASDMSQDILTHMEEQEQMGGRALRKRTLHKRSLRKRSLRKRSLRVQRKQRRKQTQRKRTHRRK